MANPKTYTLDKSFSGYQEANPAAPLPGNWVDAELASVQDVVNDHAAAIKDIRRTDGRLKNGIVSLDSLAPDLRNSLQGATITRTLGQLNVVDYFYTGDSDWSAAFQRAYDAALEAPSGGDIFIPPPLTSKDEYRISQQIQCDLETDKQISFSGVGHASRVKIHSSLGENGAFKVTAPTAKYEALVRFNNFSIVGFGTGGVGAELLNGNGTQFFGMRFLQMLDAIRSESSFAVGCDLTRFRDLSGRAFHSTTIAHDTVFSRCNLNTVGRANDVSAIKIDAASDNIIVVYCDIEGGHHLLEMNGGRALSVLGNYIEYYDGEWFKFASTVYAPIIEGNWLALSPDQTLSNMDGGRFCNNSIYDQAPGAMFVAFDEATFKKMKVEPNRYFGTATIQSGNQWGYLGSGAETTKLFEDRSLNFRNLLSTVVANQYIGGVAFKNMNNVSIAGIGAHYKNSGDGALCYLSFKADNIDDAFKIDSSMATAKGGVADATGQLQALPRSTTAALEAIGNAINTTNKFTGKAVINTTTGAIVTASGASAGAVWTALNGTTAHTPA